MAISKKQLESVIALPGQKRFEIFIKSIADWQQAWGLYQDGWALAATDDGVTVFPLWPAKEYAEVCAENEWENFEPRPISLEDLLEALLPRLKNDGILPGVFYTPSSNGVTPSVDELVGAINEELEKY
ncbi:MAG: DUF2750 domain-containing protein [Pseudomonadota bacterium]|jgi:hypothetical protein